MKTRSTIALLFFSFTLFAQDNDAVLKACLAGDLATVKANIEGGGNVNYKNAAGQTPVSCAFFWPEITSYLLGKGADVNGGDYPALANATNYYSAEVMALLIKGGADVNKAAEVKSDPGTVYKKLLDDEKAKGKQASKPMIKAYEDLLSKAVPTTLTFLPLQNAIRSGCKECVQLLLNAGAKPNYKNSTGGNALHEIAESYTAPENRSLGIKAAAPMLEKYGMKVPEWYANIDVAKIANVNDLVKMVKDKGCDIQALNAQQQTPLKVAMLRPGGEDEVADAMIANGANEKEPGLQGEPTPFTEETENPDKIKVKFDFPGEGRHASGGGGYSANMELVNPKPKRVALISYYLYDPGKGKSSGGAYTGTASVSVWRTPDEKGQQQINGFYRKSITALKTAFKENGIDLLEPEEFLDTDEKTEFYYGFSQESAKKEKTTITKRRSAGVTFGDLHMAEATVGTLKISPSNKGYRQFFVANEGEDESMISNFENMGIFGANRKMTSSLGYELAKGLGVDAVVVVYICTRKIKMNKEDYGVNAVVTAMFGPNPGKTIESDPDAKNLGQFYCGTRTYYSSPVLFKVDKDTFGQYKGMANVLKAHAARMCKYVNGKEKDTE